MTYRVKITDKAWSDIQTQTTYYELQQSSLGERFIQTLRTYQSILTTYPFAQVRYGNVRCIPMKEFPFMIHFVVNETERLVTVVAVLHTSLDPNSHWKGSEWNVSEPKVIYSIR